MTTEPASTPPDTRRWWRILVAITVLGPFLPFLCTGMNLERATDYGGLALGTALWFLAFIIVAAITGWKVNARRDFGARIGLTLLFMVAASAFGLGIGIGECAAVKAVVPRFPM